MTNLPAGTAVATVMSIVALEDRVAALEAAVAELRQPEPEFMCQVRVDTYRANKVESVRLTHLPTGVQVDAGSRAEAVVKLRKALAARDRRQHDLEQRTAKEAPGAA